MAGVNKILPGDCDHFVYFIIQANVGEIYWYIRGHPYLSIQTQSEGRISCWIGLISRGKQSKIQFYQEIWSHLIMIYDESRYETTDKNQFLS